jgi:hypothetical protein
MDKKTFEALKKIMDQLEERIGGGLDDEIEQVLSWMDEVENEIDG